MDTFRGSCDDFITKCTDLPGDEQPVAQLYEFLKRCQRETDSGQFDGLLTGDLIARIMKVSLLIKDTVLRDLLLDTVTDKCTDPIPLEFFHWIIGEYIKSVISISDLRDGFMYACKTLTTIEQNYEAICAVYEDPDLSDEMEDFITRELDLLLLRTCEMKDFCAEDAFVFFYISYIHGGGFDHFKSTMLPIVEKHSSSTPFMLKLLEIVYQHTKREADPQDQEYPQEEPQSFYEHMARLALQNLDLASLTAVETPPQAHTRMPSYIKYVSMLDFIDTLIDLNLHEHIELLAEKIRSQAEQIKGQELHAFWIPIIHKLCWEFKQKEINISLSAPHWTEIFRSVLHAYQTNFVGPMPQNPPAREGVLCPCEDCAQLNEYLADPNKTEGRFPLDQARRSHLEEELCIAEAEVDIKIERIGIPCTLIVTKTTKYGPAFEAWCVRRLQAAFKFAAFELHMLQGVLGVDHYDDLLHMFMLDRPEPPPQPPNTPAMPFQQDPSPLGPLAQLDAEIACIGDPPSTPDLDPNPNAVAGVKRKHIELEDTDLTGDD